MDVPTGPFALLRREGRDQVEVLTGPVETVETLADLPDDAPVLAVVPYRQVRERGFDAIDDGAPLLYLRITGTTEVKQVSIPYAVTKQDDPSSYVGSTTVVTAGQDGVAQVAAAQVGLENLLAGQAAIIGISGLAEVVAAGQQQPAAQQWVLPLLPRICASS